MLKTKNLLDVLNLLVLHDLIMAGFADVQEFTAKWENTEVITTDDRETSDSQSLGGVSLSQDEGAVLALLGTGVVRIGEFGKTCQPRTSQDAFLAKERNKPTWSSLYRRSS